MFSLIVIREIFSNYKNDLDGTPEKKNTEFNSRDMILNIRAASDTNKKRRPYTKKGKFYDLLF